MKKKVKRFNRKEIKEGTSLSFCQDDFSGNLSSIIENIKKIPARWKEFSKQFEHTKAKKYHRFEISWSCGYGDDYASPRVIGVRWETDQEFAARKELFIKSKIEQGQRLIIEKQKKAEKEKADYERLKAKFEKKNK